MGSLRWFNRSKRTDEKTHSAGRTAALRAWGRPVLERLEPRVLLSADSGGAALLSAFPSPVGESALLLPALATHTPAPAQIVFVDSAVPDSEVLMHALSGSGEFDGPAVYLDGNRNGVEQITEALANYRNLEAIYILSHGASGSLLLGNTLLDTRTIQDYTDQLGDWGRALAEEGDLLLYGCDVAVGAAGVGFLNDLSTLTGADIAASDDLTGSTALQGDWDLEFRRGTIEAIPAFSTSGPDGYAHVLWSTVVVLPDTQSYAAQQLQGCYDQTQWVADHAESEHIALVSHVGDLVNDGARYESQWVWMDGAIDVLDGTSIPYSLLPGNHDFDVKDSHQTINRFVGRDAAGNVDPTLADKSFGPSRYAGNDWFVGASDDEHDYAQIFTADGQEYLHIALEWLPRASAVAWAQQQIDAHPDLPVILSTHNYLSAALGGHATASVSDGYSGEELFQTLVYPNPQIFMVLCGHDTEWHQVSIDAAGFEVLELMADYSAYPNGGNGWMQLVTLDPDLNRVDVQTYSPTLDQFQTDATSQFSFAFDFQARFNFLQAPVAMLVSPMDQGAEDRNPAEDAVTVNTTQPHFQIQLTDVNDGVDDATVTSPTVAITKNGVLLSESVDYSFSYDPVANLISLTPAGGSFGNGLYSIGLNGGSAKIADVAGNSLVPTTLTVSIDTSVNGAPTDIALSNASVAENQPAGTVAGVLSTTDPDSGNTFTYSLVSGTGSTDNNSFVLSGNQLQTAVPFDYEVKNSYSIRVRSTDQGGLYLEKVFTIGVTDVNEAPTVALANTTASLAENVSTTPRLKVADIVVTDDALGVNTLSLSGADAALFEMGGLGLYLKAGTVLDHVGNPVLDVTVAVDDPTVGGTPDSTASLAISVTPASSSQTVTFQQLVNGYTGTVDTDVWGDAPDNQYSTFPSVRVDGRSTNYPGEGLLRFDNIFGSGPGQIPVGAQITSAQLQVNVTDDGDALKFYRMLRSWVAAETWNSLGAGIQTDGVEAASTADASTAYLAKGMLSVDVTGSVAAWVNAPATNFGWAIIQTPGTNKVQFDSAEGATPPRLIVTFVAPSGNHAPTDIALSNASGAENQPVGTVVGVLSTTDPDGGDTFTYSLVSGTGGTDNGFFTLNGNQLQTAAVFNYEARNSYSIRIRATDQGGLYVEKVFTIGVTDMNEPATVALINTTTSLPENASTTPRLKVADIVVTDDALGGNDLSLGGTDAALFEIDGFALYLKAGTILDSQSDPVLDVTVAVDDPTVGATPDSTAALAIVVIATGISQTVSFQQGVNGYAGTLDTDVWGDAPNNQYSAYPSVRVDGRSTNYPAQALLQFTDLFGSGPGQIPVGAQITSAQLELNVTDNGSALTFHRMLRPWVETETWNSLGAGIQTDDVEAVSTADASTGNVAKGVLSIDVTTSLTAWARDSATNFGWAIVQTPGTNKVQFDSSEGMTPPKLIVTFTAPPGNEAPAAALANATVRLPANARTTPRVKVAGIVVTDDALGAGIQTDNLESVRTPDVATGSVAQGVLSIDVTARLIAWAHTPSTNFGWAILQTPGTNKGPFDSSEGTTPPKRIVTFIIPCGS